MQDVIHSGKNHQHYDDCKADPESDLLSALRKGSAADRFDKRKILLVTQYAQITLAISMAIGLVYVRVLRVKV